MTDRSMQDDPERIYLEPGEGDPYDGRQWCQDNVWAEDAAYDGPEATEYIRADLIPRGCRRLGWVIEYADGIFSGVRQNASDEHGEQLREAARKYGTPGDRVHEVFVREEEEDGE